MYDSEMNFIKRIPPHQIPKNIILFNFAFVIRHLFLADKHPKVLPDYRCVLTLLSFKTTISTELADSKSNSKYKLT
jgi:hypothetical protein